MISVNASICLVCPLASPTALSVREGRTLRHTEGRPFMIESEELRRLCIGVRTKDIAVDEAVVARIEAEVDAYRDRLREEAVPLPPADLAGRLSLIGWLIYETSLMLLWAVKPEFDKLPADKAGESLVNAALIERL